MVLTALDAAGASTLRMQQTWSVCSWQAPNANGSRARRTRCSHTSPARPDSATHLCNRAMEASRTKQAMMACFVREASPRSHDGGPSSSPTGRWWTKRGTHEAGLTVGRHWMDPQPLTAARTARAGAERRTDPGSDRWGGSLARPNPIGDRPMQRVHCRDRHCSSCAAAVQLGTPDRADGGWGCVHNQRNTEGQTSGHTTAS